MSKNKQFKALLQQPNAFILPGAYDGMTARLIEESGFPAIYATGAGISNAQLGWADVGLTAVTEIADVVSRMSDVTNVPIVVDGDTGFGNAINLMRTVKQLERAGASAIQFEDQVAPKKCGHFGGKQVISKEEMIYKIKAAVDTRKDDNLSIIARTDALAVYGMGEALDRANAYKEAGADVIFVEAPTTIAQLMEITANVPDIPHIINMVEGGSTPLVSLEEAEEMGFQIMLCANTVLRSAIKGIQESLRVLKQERSQQNIHDLICTWEERQELFKLKQIKQWEKEYLEFDRAEEAPKR
ncbi:isocitrate lyase/PEP mutase family protein [Planococcus shenhongbingii]|uniref:Isocitrate lyase/PEP mutase family protein n=1 Tax=Planococcus shenhongbingii TaxID=3058398 RepID=A0ABT8NH56_9BACL|nr:MULTISPECIES: isocitrate lyase/PEP mutase family protein [unclassified Planococcus (in: firmicutes)]MDN7247054.1 isocitrate lyase/PEP mutase family protein [Planococcus sp. N017]WKA56955.1 isocitrate lyase/PEP mutase family protein [Planococcus sp. N016]